MGENSGDVLSNRERQTNKRIAEQESVNMNDNTLRQQQQTMQVNRLKNRATLEKLRKNEMSSKVASDRASSKNPISARGVIAIIKPFARVKLKHKRLLERVAGLVQTGVICIS